MIPDLRRDFNQRFTREKYARFLSLVNERSGAEVKFRLSETPCFFPAALIETMQQAGKELIHQLVGNETYLEAARREIPKGLLTPHETKKPLFLQVDFGLIKDEQGVIVPRLVEIQAFPSLYAFEPVVERAYREVYGLGDAATASGPFREAVLGKHAPENVILLEIDPQHQKTLPDFLLTERLCGIQTVDIRDLKKQGRRLYHRGVPVERIYNRAIADELIRRNVETEFHFDDDIEVEWAGHPNWFFRLSKFSLPYLHHPAVPRAQFLDRVDRIDDPERYVLKPLYSFAGLGVVVGPTAEEIAAVPSAKRSQYLLQERVDFIPVIETPEGKAKIEVRIMYIWLEEMTAVNTIIRMGRGAQMGVDHNKNLDWVGGSAGFLA